MVSVYFVRLGRISSAIYVWRVRSARRVCEYVYTAKSRLLTIFSVFVLLTLQKVTCHLYLSKFPSSILGHQSDPTWRLSRKWVRISDTNSSILKDCRRICGDFIFPTVCRVGGVESKRDQVSYPLADWCPLPNIRRIVLINYSCTDCFSHLPAPWNTRSCSN